ncbi:hypothetical protein ACWEVP_31850 [Amycolatopsis sp. NPDC003865]
MHVITWHVAAYGAAAGTLLAGFIFLGVRKYRQAARRRRKERMTGPMRALSAARKAASLGDTPAATSRAEDWRPIIAVRLSVNPDTAQPDRTQRWTVRL